MPESIRLFVAVLVSEATFSTGHEEAEGSTPVDVTLSSVLDELREIGKPVKPVAAHNLHITLKFLGDTDPEIVPEIEAIVNQAASSETAFQWTFRGVGAFPSPKRPSVVWAGIENAEPCIRMATQLNESLETLGFSAEKREFHPHLTLARIKGRPPRELFDLLEQHENTFFGTGSVNAIELIQSELTPEGPVYTMLLKAPLAPCPRNAGT